MASPSIIPPNPAPTKISDRWSNLKSIVATPGPFTSRHAVVGAEAMSNIIDSKILVIGAGGLGCEMLKNLALSGFVDIHVVDMDTIDISNLNRQFLFRESDVSLPKATVAANFVMARVGGGNSNSNSTGTGNGTGRTLTITPHQCRIQDLDPDFYRQFAIIMCGLDNMEARRWINSLVVGLVEPDDWTTIKPLIDGGTEGFGGQAKVIIPTLTSCIECQMDMYAARPEVPLCTIASIPRQPEHCVEWAQILAWPQERPDDTIDTDDPEHITWLFTKALTRARQHDISGVTYSLTQGVVKNIIPAIASTNAIVAAACCNEAFKIVTAINPCLGNLEDGAAAPTYMMYTGDQGTYSYTFRPGKKDDCPVCGVDAMASADRSKMADLTCEPGSTLQEVISSLSEKGAARGDGNGGSGGGDNGAEIEAGTVATDSGPIYFTQPTSLEEQTRPNLKRKICDLVDDGGELAVTDARSKVTYKFRVRFRSDREE